MPIETEGHEQLVDEFFNDVKSFGITEIQERRSLAETKKLMLVSRYMKWVPSIGYRLYYIMQ